MEEVELVKQTLSTLDAQRHSLSTEEEERIRSIGDRFPEVWQNGHCPPALKKMILRTAIEEIIVRTDQDKKSLELVLHWKGGIHTQLSMDRPRSATDTATPIEALEIIRWQGRFASATTDQIASVFEPSRLFYRQRGSDGIRPGWPQPGVTIPLPVKSEPYSIRRELSLGEAARICDVSHRTIERLVETGVLEREQSNPSRTVGNSSQRDLDTAPIRRDHRSPTPSLVN